MKSFAYDEIGNFLTYYNGSAYTFTWEGRRLVGAVKGSKTMSFTYNDEGLRTSKTVNGATITYLYDGTRLIAEYAPGYTCVYIYDESGSIIGAKYISTAAGSTWQIYFFEKNLQGDVIAVYSDTGTKLISYRYDAWGNTTTTYHNSGASTLAANNRITYRGYYYDTDLGMYYLQSRYYDAKICRFINADGYVSTGQGILGYNMFAYCNNNPVNYVDYSGQLSVSTLVAVILFGVGVIVALTSSSTDAQDKTGELNDAFGLGLASGEFLESTQAHNEYIYAYSEAVVEYNKSGNIVWNDTLGKAFSNKDKYYYCIKRDSEFMKSYYINSSECMTNIDILYNDFPNWAPNAKGEIFIDASEGAIDKGYKLLETILGLWTGIAG